MLECWPTQQQWQVTRDLLPQWVIFMMFHATGWGSFPFYLNMQYTKNIFQPWYNRLVLRVILNNMFYALIWPEVLRCSAHMLHSASEQKYTKIGRLKGVVIKCWGVQWSKNWYHITTTEHPGHFFFFIAFFSTLQNMGKIQAGSTMAPRHHKAAPCEGLHSQQTWLTNWLPARPTPTGTWTIGCCISYIWRQLLKHV